VAALMAELQPQCRLLLNSEKLSVADLMVELLNRF
jgi:hypothetical protein